MSIKFLTRYENYINIFATDDYNYNYYDDINNGRDDRSISIQRKLGQLKQSFDSIFTKQLRYNYDISVSQCNGALVAIESKYMSRKPKNSNKNTNEQYNINTDDIEYDNKGPLYETHWTIKSIEKDLYQNELIFNSTCKGPAFDKQYFQLFKNFKNECVGTVLINIQESKVRYSKIFFCYLLFIVAAITAASIFLRQDSKRHVRIQLSLVTFCVVCWILMVVFHPIVYQLGINRH